MSDPVISSTEWVQITAQLETHHALFYQMWSMGRPTFDVTIPTAAVSFNKNGDYVGFIFNPQFWEKLNLEEKKFIICHECLHVILRHGLRSINSKDFDKANIAMDIAVNHSLVNNFGFDRNKLTINKDLCWTDTVFPGQDIPDTESFEYYWNKMPLATGLKNSIDDHSMLESFDEDAIDKVVEKLNENLSDEEKQSLQNSLQATADDAVGSLFTIDIGKVVKKKKWETVIKQWSKKYCKQDDRSVEQWARIARRYATLSSDLFLPTEVEHDSLTEDRIQVWFFQDCSGSCVHLKNRFFKAAKSLPKERFDIKMHTFDTKVYEVDINDNKIRGGGGTSFGVIEAYIQRYIQKHKLGYPKAIFLITDGYGNHVNPETPENWYWFLSASNRYYIPRGSNVYNLSDFE